MEKGVNVMSASKSRKGSIASDLGTLLLSGRGADVTFVVGHSLLPAHSFVLAARSPVFAAMFENKMQEASSRRIQITDMQEAALRQLLSFLYTDTVPKLESVAAELLAAADKYDLPLLKRRCEQQVAERISVDNTADVAALAELHGCSYLSNSAVCFIARNPKLLATEGWERLLRNNAGAAVEISKRLAVLLQPSAVVAVVRDILPSSDEDE